MSERSPIVEVPSPSSMEILTEKQEMVLEIIRDYQLEHGTSPTLRELREALGVSSDNSILKHLTGLEEKGYISRRDGSRSIEMLGSVKQRLDTPSENRLPLLGFVPAGGPVMSEEYISDWYTVGEDLIYKLKSSFLLRVTGDSMINAGIHEGDLVVVCSSLEPKVNDIVVALVDNGNTVKRFMKDSKGPYLKAENPKYPPIHAKHDLEIQGVVTGLIRLYKR